MDEYLSFGSNLAYKAGKIMRTNFVIGMEKSLKDGDGSPVTESDTKINEMVIDAIHSKYPSHSIIGEETSKIKKGEFTWLCDPVDGTIPFSSGMPISTFSLALVKNGEPIIGVVYDPFMDRLFTGSKNGGAFLNKKRVYVSSANAIKSEIIYLGWWKYSLYNLLDVRSEINKRGSKVMDFCSFVYAGALVAAGEFSGLIFGDIFPWDMAALKVIIEEAGGKCTDIEGKSQSYDRDINGFVAGNENIHRELLSILNKHKHKN